MAAPTSRRPPRFRWSRSILLAVTSVFAQPNAAAAFADDGHRIIGEVASHYLEPRTAASVKVLLDDPGYATLAEAATWADTYARTVAVYAWAKPLHYVNVDPKASRYVAARDCPEKGCVVTAIERFRSALSAAERQGNASEAREALYFLAHLVGDIHQPLHVAHPDGRGGNSTQLVFFGAPVNAHWVWDEGLVAKLIEGSSVASTARPPNPPGWQTVAFKLRMELAPEQVRRWQTQLDPEQWANESLQLAKQYGFLRAGVGLGEPYRIATAGVLQRQLQKAGVRLAQLLNETIGRAAPVPTAQQPT